MKSVYEEIKALNQSSVSPRAKALYLALMEIAGSESKCKPTVASLEYKSGVSESTVLRATTELEVAGFISVVRFPKRGPNTPPNLYTMILRAGQSCQIDSTSPVKLTDKNTNRIDEDTTTTLTTSTACHPDTRGSAPGIRDDRPDNMNKDLLSLLKKHQPHFIKEEVIPLAREVVSLVGFDKLDSKLKLIKGHYCSLNKSTPPIQDRLKMILEAAQMSAAIHAQKN